MALLIKDLPPELQALCHKRQIEQGNNGKFDEDLSRGRESGNFTWNETPEGNDFWQSLYVGKDVSGHPMYPHPDRHNIFN